MASNLNLYRTSGRTLSILPCASVEGGCELHRSGRNQPCLEPSTSTKTISKSKATATFNTLPSQLRRASAFSLARYSAAVSLGSSSSNLNLSRLGKVRLYGITNKDAYPEVPPLLTLPVELLQAISLLLPPSSFISLTLTCTALATALGTDRWKSLLPTKTSNDKYDEFEQLLILLQRDQPTYRFCKPCEKLHSPTHSTVPLPRNVLTRRDEPSPILRRTALYFLEPGPWGKYSYQETDGPLKKFEMEARIRRPAYWLSYAHVEAAMEKRICLASLSCKSKIAIPVLLEYGVVASPACGDATLHFEYNVQPMLARKRFLLFETTFTFIFTYDPSNPDSATIAGMRVASMKARHEDSVKDLLALCTDLRPCVHAPENLLVEEIICYLFHQWMEGPHRGSVACEREVEEKNKGNMWTATDGGALPPDPLAADPLGLNVDGTPLVERSPAVIKHKKKLVDWYENRSCNCVSDFEMMVNGVHGTPNPLPNHPLEKMEVKIWNLFGEKPGERDEALRQPGMLKSLWYDELWVSDGGGW